MGEIRGLFTAMVTPFRADGSVNDEAGVALARHLLEHGSHGLVICGTTGEATTLSDSEHVDFVRTIASELGDEHPIFAGAGSNDTRHAAHLTEAVVEAGAQAVLSVTPYYNKPNRRGLIAHFSEVARAASGRPVILYNIPSRTALNMPPDLLAELAQIDGIEAVKQANTDELQLIDGLAVLAGNDDALAACMDIGGAGGICVASHVVGPEMRRIVDEPDARAEIDAGLRELYAVMFVTASPAPVKAALAMLGHDVGGLRLPLVEVDDAEREQVRAALARHGLLRETSPA
jgi:4-hydroxy-tetrahydrodipicolinate synthase